MPPTSIEKVDLEELKHKRKWLLNTSSCHKIQSRLDFIFSVVMFLLVPMPSFFHSFLTSCSLHWGAGLV